MTNYARNYSQNIVQLLQHIMKEDVANFIIDIENANKGDGYLGEISFCTLKERNGDKLFNFVVKQAFTTEQMRKLYPIRNVFVNEIYFYKNVWKKFEDFFMKFQLTKVFDKIPKCFATISEELTEVLILENLKLQNFETFGKLQSFSKEHVELLFSEFGKFHAISFAYKYHELDEYLKVSEGLRDLWQVIVTYKYFINFIKILHGISLKCLIAEEKAILDKYKKYAENSVKIFTQSLKYNGDYSVVLHGDCWNNNLMFKYDESGKVVDVRLIDFQFARVGTPVYDLSYCLYSGAGKEIYNDLDYYLKVYHDSLSHTLKDFGCDGETLYPFVALKEDWKKYSIFGFTMALLVWKGRLTYDENVVDLTDFQNDEDKIAEGFLSAEYDEEAYKEKIRDLILHMYQNGFL